MTTMDEARAALPWLVLGRSHEHEWNGRVGRRFKVEERARSFAARMEAEGWHEVRVMFAPVPR